MELGDFLEQMRAAGALDSEGHFTIAGKEAAARLATFAQSIPFFVLLRLVQAGVCAGVRAVQVDQGFSSSLVRFEGGSWSPLELHLLSQDLGRALGLSDDKPGHHLAVALGASGSAKVRMVSADRLEVTVPMSFGLGTENNPVTVPALRAAAVSLEHISVVLGVIASSGGGMKAWCQLPDGCLAELVRGRPRGSGVAPFTLGRAVHDPDPRGLVWNGLVLRQWQDGVGADRLIGGLSAPRSHMVIFVGPRPVSTHVTFVKYGVTMGQQVAAWGLPVQEVLVEADDLPVDLSGMKAIENAALQERLEAVRREVLVALAEAKAHLAGLPPPRGGVPDWVAYTCMGAGVGLGLLTWQPGFPAAGMAVSAFLFGHGGRRQLMRKQARLLGEVLASF